MTVKVVNSVLSGKLAAAVKEAVGAHKHDEVELGRVDLPAGIQNGVARLSDCKIDLFKIGDYKDQPYFIARGVVLLPKEHLGLPVSGLQTTLMPEAICETPKREGRKTVAEHVKWIVNEIKKLNKAWADDPDGMPEDLETCCEFLKKMAPFFRFRTWQAGKRVIAQDAQGKFRVFEESADGVRQLSRRTPGAWATMEAAQKSNPYVGSDPRVNHDWSGQLVDFVPPADLVPPMGDATSGDEDPAPAAAPVQQKSRFSQPSTQPAKAPANGATPGKKVTPTPVEAPTFTDQGNLDSLAEIADDNSAEGQSEAQNSLTAFAQEAGVTEEELTDAENWTAVVTLIKERTGGDLPVADDDNVTREADEVPPDVGDVIKFHVVTAGKKAPRPTQCVIKSVNVPNRTVNVSALSDNKMHKGVSWDEFVP